MGPLPVELARLFGDRSRLQVAVRDQDAGTGAAIGAAGGAVAGRHKKKGAEKEAAQQGAAAAESQASASLTTFSKSMSSCLQGKGYTVN